MNSTANRESNNRLSQVLAERVTTRNRSSSSPPLLTKNVGLQNQLSIEFEGSSQVILRPNRIIKATQIRIKFRAEEVATAKVREYGLESKIERIDQVITSWFNVETKVWGKESSAYSMSTWQMIEPGEYKYPFALKFPNVNFPPSSDDPPGFSIRYILSAHLDGPACNPGLRSKDYIVPYRPIISAPPTKQWSFTQSVVQSDKKSPIGNVTAHVPRSAFCPDEDVDMSLYIESFSSDLIVSAINYTLYKHSDGQIQLQRGLARKTKVRQILQSTASIPGNAGSILVPIQFHVPTRLVSPSFQSRHINVYYDIVFTIQFSNRNRLKSTLSVDFILPIGITNLPYNHLLHIQHLTSVQSYLVSKESPVFFDPALDEPPSHAHLVPLSTPPIASPPSYFSIQDVPSQFIQRDREEKTMFTSRLIKPGMSPELGDPIVIVSENKDYECYDYS
ncbi:hypothetical protein G6F62_009451 [Rhizopus arrhizus]|nr:hypothetical protein G6F62_009451 [Rhizopus arrhizus]